MPEWNRTIAKDGSAELIVKKSRFICNVQRVASEEDAREKLTALKKQYWGGKDLPFPILLDASGDTLKRYGIMGFPTTILIDPEGRVIRGGNAKVLAEKLKKEKRNR